MAADDALIAVFSRNAFYKRLHYLALGAFALSLLVIGFLTWMLIYMLSHPVRPLYFAVDEIGRLIDVVPVSKPNMTTQEASNFALDAIISAFSMDYVNYRSQLQGAQKYFTTYGWSKYMGALKSNNNLLALTQRRQIVNVQIVGQPKLITQGLLAGAYAWKFEMPMLATYWEPPYDDRSKYSNALIVTIIIQRQPILQSYKGVGVVQIIARMANTPITRPQEISSTPTG